MGLKDFFKRNKQTASISPSGEFWKDVESLCEHQVSKTIAYFLSKKAPMIDWAEPRFRQLMETSSLQPLIESAKLQLNNLESKIVNPAKPVGIFQSWYICVTVFPSEADALFIENCPNKNAEDYIYECRKEFRDFTPGWAALDYAHWILLLNEPNYQASIHLYTQWNFEFGLRRIAEGYETKIVLMPPLIIPTDLISHSHYEFDKRMFNADVRFANLKKDYLQQMSIGRQIAKLLFMDSITRESPMEFWNPLEYRTTKGQSFDLIGQVVDLHHSDCKKINVDIPLLIGVPRCFSKEIKAHLQTIEYKLLKPEQVCVFSESESAFFQMDGSFVMRNKYEMKKHLLGGGACLAALVEAGQISEFWKQGIRWLLIGQVFNQGVSINPGMLKRLMSCKEDGIMEVVKRDLVPTSKLPLLKQNEQLFCMDERGLKGSTGFKELPQPYYVCTGTFWIRCEKLAEIFGITKPMLEAEWNQAEWEGKFSDKLLTQHAILCKSKDMELGMLVPPWELFKSLKLEAVQVGAERINLFSIAEDSL